MGIGKKWVQWMGNRGLATKWFLILFVTIFTLFIGLSWKSLVYTETLFKDQVIADARLLTERTNQFLDSHLNHVQSMIIYLSSRSDLLEPSKSEEAIQFLRQFSLANYQVTRAIYLIGADGAVYSDQQLLYDIRQNPQLERMYRSAVENGGIQWSEPYESKVVLQTVAFSKTITNREGAILGVAVMELDLGSLAEKLTPLYANSSQTFIVLSPDGQIVANDRKTTLLPLVDRQVFQIKPEFIGKLHRIDNGVTDLSDEAQPGSHSLVAVKSNLNNFRWSIVLLIDKATFFQSVSEMNRNYRDAGIILAVLLLAVSFAMSRYFVRPISRLAVKMDRIHSIEYFPNLPVKRNDEIGRLIRSYNEMLDRIRLLVKEQQLLERSKKEIELQLLQSQIRPHFLYNTFAAIHGFAKQQRILEVGDTIRNLSGLLTFTFNKRSECIPLSEELEGLRMYVQIQMLRYPRTFVLEKEICPETLGCLIPKLTLQPLVENAIFHGVVPKEQDGVITIRAWIRRGNLKLLIADNGLGMSRVTQGRLLDRLEASAQTGTGGNGLNSIGVANVHHRLRLYYGEQYGLRIRSREGNGTQVWVTLPIPSTGLPSAVGSLDDRAANSGNAVRH